ncbi:hypothetical protein MnTg03_01168 [bacterium MnTg03]|nr:hypothetical protein MnTg03_01168 [bacterium MnTg03]
MDNRNVEDFPALLGSLGNFTQRFLGHAWIVLQRHLLQTILRHIAHQADKTGDCADIAAPRTEFTIHLGDIKIFFLHLNSHVRNL